MNDVMVHVLPWLNLLLIPVTTRLLSSERRLATLEAQMNILLAHSGVRSDLRK